MPADPERATAIENSLARTLRFAAEELSNSPDRTASKLGQATTQLESSEAVEHLSTDTIAKFRAQIADLQAQVEAAERAEKAGRIERDVKRVLSSLEDEIRTNGSQIESYLERAAVRLTKDDVRESLTPEAIAALEGQLAELRAKVGRSAPPPPPPRAVAPERPVTAAPAPAPHAAAAVPPPPSPAPSAPSPAPAQESEEAQRIKSSIARTLRNAEGDIDSPGWRQTEGRIGQAATQIMSPEATQHLSAETLDAFRAQLTALEAKFAAHDHEERIEESENYLRRLVRDAEEHVDWPDRIGGMLEKIAEVLDSDSVRTVLPADRAAFYRNEIARIEGKAGGNQRQKAIDDASGPLAELESRVAPSIFDGLDERDTQQLWGDLERLQSKVGYALDRLPEGDADGKALRARLDAVVERRGAAYGATKQTSVMARVAEAWNEALGKVAGWETETQDTTAAALGGEFMPRTREAMRILNDTLSGSSLFSPIPDARKEYADDPALKKVVTEGERMVDSGVAKMIAAFDAIMDAADDIPTPTGEFELRRASFMADRAREAFDGTPHMDARVARANGLLALWESTIERARQDTVAYYDKCTAEAASTWPQLASSIAAEEGFEPSEASWRGKTVRINGFRNRMRWDFTGDYAMALWVNETPVAAHFEPWVREAFNTAEQYTRSAIDDHTDWDAVVVIGGPGKLKQRFKSKVTKDGKTLGEIEEWLPVDCVTCRVIALRAGPCVVAPS